MRKYPGTTDFETIKNRIVPSYAQSDTGDVRIVPANTEGNLAPTLSRRDADDEVRALVAQYASTKGAPSEAEIAEAMRQYHEAERAYGGQDGRKEEGGGQSRG